MDRRKFMKSLALAPLLALLPKKAKKEPVCETFTTGTGVRGGTTYVFANEADPDAEIVAMTKWHNEIYLATKKGVYRIEGNRLVGLKFEFFVDEKRANEILDI